MNPLLMQLFIVCLLVAACTGGITLGRRLNRRDRRRATIARIMEYRA